ncbi:hypothetical protein [Sulfitobacter dubius]|uniref:hypothetical protein n=1 Tax=Sulfitobacter dubius TaxID=218673 RepID=UPI0022AF990A|nr:hypothetical protein [Sulfitobacter dubius]MCZ4368832.1 hypothetical protein [Sulfitobacter dubius]
MKTSIMRDDSIENFATTAVRLGRQLQQEAHSIFLGGSSREFQFVNGTFRRLAERDPFDPRDEASFEAIRGILEVDLKSEIEGTERRFFESHYDEDGQHGEIRDCPIYSKRGEALLAVKRTFDSFLHARAETLDRIAAERALLRLLTS